MHKTQRQDNTGEPHMAVGSKAKEMIGWVVVMAIGLGLVGTVAGFQADAESNLTDNPAALALVGLLTLLFVAGLIFYSLDSFGGKKG